MSDGPEKPQMPSDDDIRERFERIREQLSHDQLPDLPDEELPQLRNVSAIPDFETDEVDAKLTRLEGRVKKAKSTYQTTFNKEPVKLAKTQQEAQGLGVGLMVAYTIMGMPLLGIGIGWLLDRLFKSTIWIPILGLGGATLGVVVAVVMVNNSAQNQK